MVATPPVVFLGLDAVDVRVASQLLDRGALPTLQRLLHQGASVETESPAGVFVTAHWATLATGRDPAHHGYLCWKHFSPGSYADEENSPRVVEGRPFWEVLSDAGRRVAVVDVPHSSAPERLHGAMVVEWGCHDRHFGTHSRPAALVDDLDRRFGAHPIGTRRPPTPTQTQFAPCDYLYRRGRHRTPAEAAALWEAVVEGHARKRAASLHLLDQGPWDLYAAVFGEGHCTGHQLWSVHDTTHPRHDPELRARIGDPVADMYRRLDDTVAAHLARLAPGTTVYVHLSHGMGPHHDGNHLLDDVLRRLSGGTGARRRAALRLGAGGAVGLARRRGGPVARATLRRALSAPGEAPDLGPDPDPDPAGTDRRDRPWFAIPNNTVSGAVRFNVIGREARGVLAPGADLEAAVERVRRGLLELVNADTGEPAVVEVHRSDRRYRRRPGDALADLFVEWNRRAPIERVWSPRVGLVARAATHWRTGDHTPGGLLVAAGPGIVPGRRPGRLPVVHVGVTVAAAAGVALPDVDGAPVDFLLPATTGVRGVPVALGGDGPVLAVGGTGATGGTGGTGGTDATGGGGPGRAVRARRARRRVGSDRLTAHAADLAGRLDLLGDAHHGTRTRADQAFAVATQIHHSLALVHERLAQLEQDEQRAIRLERQASIQAVTSWVRQAEVPESLLVSIVVPTRNRAALVRRAVASAQAQVYGRWELLVVDDGSHDATPEVLARLAAQDHRIRALRAPGGNSARARNQALGAATGDVVVYLDDDNVLDPLWCKAVVWAFTQRPDVEVLYGARVIDDVRRVERTGAGAMPLVHFEPWDRATLEQHNIADMGVIAHRRCLPGAWFDPDVPIHADWDLLLRLTRHRAPLELPVVALYYTSDAPHRLSDGDLFDIQRVRDKLRGPANGQPGAAPAVGPAAAASTPATRSASATASTWGTIHSASRADPLSV